MAAATDTIRYHVTGMDCASCAAKIEGAARKVEGVGDVKVSIASQIMTLNVDDPQARLPVVEQVVTSLGYQLDRIGQPKVDGVEADEDDDKIPDLSHVTSAYKRALWIVVLLNVGYGVIEIIGSFLSGSQALQADALDFVGDGLISFLGLIAVGWGLAARAKAALLQGVFLGLLGLGVIGSTLYRVFVAHQPETFLMGSFAVVAFIVNVAAALVLLALVLAAGRALGKRQPAAAAAAAPAALELAPTDLVKAQTVEMELGLPVSGTLKAVNSAVVKARVAGELQGLVVREGDAVQAGQLLGRIDPTEYQARLQQAQQQADAARAQMDIAQRQYDNNKALVDQNFISRTALDTSLANLQAAQATHRAALAAADVARKAVDDTLLRAPLAGLVSQRLAQPGERLPIDAKVLEIVDLGRLELEASVGAAESLLLRTGQRAQLRLEGSDAPVQATLVRINPSAQAASRSVLAYLAIDGAKAGVPLRQGLFAQGTLGAGRQTVVAVPVSAVRVDKAQPYMQLLADGRVAHQAVNLGERGSVAEQDMVEVNLPAGTQVIAGAVGPLREGVPVRVTTLAAEPAKSAP